MGFQSGLRKTVLGAAFVACAASLTACGGMPAAYQAAMTPTGPNPDKLSAGCVWPNDANRITYFSDHGNIYDTRASGVYGASITAYLGGILSVDANYNAQALVFLSPSTGEYARLTVSSYPRIVNNGYNSHADGYIPSQAALLSDNYAFRDAARAAIYATQYDLSARPTQFCHPYVLRAYGR